MKQNVLDKRRKEGWRITLWCERVSVCVQITTNGGEEDKSPDVDVLCRDFTDAVKFAKTVCRHTSNVVMAASSLVPDWRISPDSFLELLDGHS